MAAAAPTAPPAARLAFGDPLNIAAENGDGGEFTLRIEMIRRPVAAADGPAFPGSPLREGERKHSVPATAPAAAAVSNSPARTPGFSTPQRPAPATPATAPSSPFFTPATQHPAAMSPAPPAPEPAAAAPAEAAPPPKRSREEEYEHWLVERFPANPEGRLDWGMYQLLATIVRRGDISPWKIFGAARPEGGDISDIKAEHAVPRLVLNSVYATNIDEVFQLLKQMLALTKTEGDRWFSRMLRSDVARGHFARLVKAYRTRESFEKKSPNQGVYALAREEESAALNYFKNTRSF